MALNKTTLQNSIHQGFKRIFEAQSAKGTSGDESEDPKDVINQVTKDMAKVVADAVEVYVKSGDVIVGPDNFTVTSAAPGSLAAVAPTTPAKMT